MAALLDYKTAKDGTYYIDKYIDGKRCHIRAKTVKDLDKKLKAWLKESSAEKARAALGPTFEEVANEWWAADASRMIEGTQKSYRPAYEYWCSFIGSARMKDLETHDITDGLRLLIKKDYAQKTVNNYKLVAGLICDYYVNSHWAGDKNIAKLSSMPKGAKKGIKRKPPSESQLNKLLESPQGFGYVAYILAYTGMRIAEANAIQVKDIDLEAMCYQIKGGISVNKQARWPSNKALLQPFPKTDAGNRMIPVFAPLRPVIEERIKGLKPDDYLLSGEKEPFSRNVFNRKWINYLREHGCASARKRPKKRKDGSVIEETVWTADVTPHQFRHFLATACYEANVPVLVAQKIMGHKDIATTQRVYTDIRDRLMADSAKSLENLFTNNSPKTK